MNELRVSSVLVAEQGHLVGIFTERDLLRRVADAVIGWRNYPVSEWMTKAPYTIHPEAGWEDAFLALANFKVRHLPVVQDGLVVGILTPGLLMARRNEFLNEKIEERTQALRQTNNALIARDQETLHNMRAAGRLLTKLMPQSPPTWPEFDWNVHYAPLDELGGDYYDFAEPDGVHQGFLMADASGHSIAAAMVAIMTRVAFAEVARTTIHPGEVLASLNQRLNGMPEERFVTAFYGVFNRHTRVLRFASAGHPYPLHYSASTKEIKPLMASGFLLGIIPDEVYTEREVQLAPGDVICFYTDGLIEARNEIGELYGTTRLTQCMESIQHTNNAAAHTAALLAGQNEFSGTASATDDLTLAFCCIH